MAERPPFWEQLSAAAAGVPEAVLTPRDGYARLTMPVPAGLDGLSERTATLLFIAFVRAARGRYSAAHHIGLEVTGLYWHFVDVVWILLYTVVYLI